MPARYAFMEKVIPKVATEPRRWLAVDVRCPACGVPSGTACAGPRFHTERMQLAAQLARDGQLAEAPPVTVAGPCEACGDGGWRGQAPACSPEHQCSRIRGNTGERCTSAVAPGSRYCGPHKPRMPTGRFN
jgi:hypothetical protein